MLSIMQALRGHTGQGAYHLEDLEDDGANG